MIKHRKTTAIKKNVQSVQYECKVNGFDWQFIAQRVRLHGVPGSVTHFLFWCHCSPLMGLPAVCQPTDIWLNSCPNWLNSRRWTRWRQETLPSSWDQTCCGWTTKGMDSCLHHPRSSLRVQNEFVLEYKRFICFECIYKIGALLEDRL